MKKFVIVPYKYIDYVDFSLVQQDNRKSVRRSLDGEYFLLKYEGEQPEFIFNITQDAVGLEEFNKEEISQILNNHPLWSSRG
jgi:hypothetical protein